MKRASGPTTDSYRRGPGVSQIVIINNGPLQKLNISVVECISIRLSEEECITDFIGFNDIHLSINKIINS